MLKTYDAFIRRVNELGFFAFDGQFAEGFPMLSHETEPEQWHTGDAQTDPWQWKDRAAEEKKLAFGNLLGGCKGFIAQSMYAMFYAACAPAQSITERYKSGLVSQTALDVYGLFEDHAVLSTSEIRKALGVTKKTGAGRVDTALRQLQKEFALTVCSTKRKVSFDGLPYGWPANAYCRVEDWAPKAWLSGAEGLSAGEARSRILDAGCAVGNRVDSAALSKYLFGKAGGKM